MARQFALGVVEVSSRPSIPQSIRELWAFREVMWAFAERTVRLKYKQAALGFAWAVLQPLALLAIFVVLFGRIAQVSGGTVPYPASALAALVAWFFVQTSVSLGAETLLRDGALVRKVFFPREAAILGTVMSSGLDFLIGLGLVVALGPWLGTKLSWTVLLAVPLLLPLALLAAGAALALGALNVYYRDFRYGLPLLIQFWMLASPVAYPLSAVSEQWRNIYIVLNPAAGLLEGFRQILAEGRLPDLALLGTSSLLALTVGAAGYLMFKRMEPGFADAI